MARTDLQIKEYVEGNENYHNTRLLLKLYRYTAYQTVRKGHSFERFMRSEYGFDSLSLLEAIKNVGIELKDNIEALNILEDIKYYEDILSYVEGCINHIKEYHPKGERYFSVLYHTYLVPSALRTNSQIRSNVSNDLGKTKIICERTYLRYLNEAISILDKELWHTDPLTCKELKEFLCKQSVEIA